MFIPMCGDTEVTNSPRISPLVPRGVRQDSNPGRKVPPGGLCEVLQQAKKTEGGHFSLCLGHPWTPAVTSSAPAALASKSSETPALQSNNMVPFTDIGNETVICIVTLWQKYKIVNLDLHLYLAQRNKTE